MLQYVSDILKNFTQRQRVFVLSLILCSLVVITIGPGIADSFFPDRENLIKNLDSQKERITELEKETRTLRLLLSQESDSCESRIRSGSMECTDAIIRRERQILEVLDILKKNAEEELVFSERFEIRDYRILDTINSGLPSTPIRIIQPGSHRILDDISAIMGEMDRHIKNMEAQKTPD